MAAFLSALGIVFALRTAQTGDQVANVLIANAARWGAEGPAVAAALVEWFAYMEAGDFLTLADETRHRCAERLWQSVVALPDATPFAAVATTIACTADVPPHVRAALLQTTDRGTSRTALVGAVATAARPALATARRISGRSIPRSRSRGACRRCPPRPGRPPSTCRELSPPPPPCGPAPSLGVGGPSEDSGAGVRASGTPADEPADPRVPYRPLPPPSVIPYAQLTAPAPAPWRASTTPGQAPQPSPRTHPPPSPVAAAPCQTAYAAPIPAPSPEARMGSPASRQLVIEVSGLNPETMTTATVRDALRAHLGSTNFIPQHCLHCGCEYVPGFEAM